MSWAISPCANVPARLRAQPRRRNGVGYERAVRTTWSCAMGTMGREARQSEWARKLRARSLAENRQSGYCAVAEKEGVMRELGPNAVHGISMHVPFPTAASYPVRGGNAFRPLTANRRPAMRNIVNALFVRDGTVLLARRSPPRNAYAGM
jgi:hypothetical protein